jgi:hypothetical protein
MKLATDITVAKHETQRNWKTPRAVCFTAAVVGHSAAIIFGLLRVEPRTEG